MKYKKPNLASASTPETNTASFKTDKSSRQGLPEGITDKSRRQLQLLLGYCKESRYHIKLFG
jgi:hypothetical protein